MSEVERCDIVVRALVKEHGDAEQAIRTILRADPPRDTEHYPRSSALSLIDKLQKAVDYRDNVAEALEAARAAKVVAFNAANAANAALGRGVSGQQQEPSVATLTGEESND